MRLWCSGLLIGLGLLGFVRLLEAQTAKRTLQITSASELAKTDFRRGFEEENASRAALSFQQALASDSTFGLARVLFGLKMPRLPTARRVLEMNRGVTDAAKGSTEELILATAYRELGMGRTQRGLVLLRAAVELMPGEALIAADYAWQLGSNGNVDQAIVVFRKLKQEYPGSASWVRFALLLLQNGDTAEAVSTAEELARVASSESTPHRILGDILRTTGQLDRARQEYTRSLALDSTSVSAHVGLAQLARRRYLFAEARANLQTAIRHAAPESEKIRLQNGIVGTFLEDGDAAGAMAAFPALTRLVEAHGSAMDVWLAYRAMAFVDLLLLKGERADAILSKLDSLKLPEISTLIRFATVASIYALAGRRDATLEAIEGLRREATAARDTSMSGAPVHLYTGLLLLREGKPLDAIVELKKAPAGNFLTPPALVAAYTDAGNRSEAQRIKAAFLKDFPVFNNLLVIIGRAWAQRIQ
jgi:Flp pilus assembly protein TadD